MQIKGVLESIIFRNDSNGYTVFVVDTGSEMVTVSGNFPRLSEGETLLLTGEYKNTKYGEQLCCTKCEILPPSDSLSIVRYLSSGLIHGVGEVTAKNIVDVFGDATLDVIERQPHLLKSVKGISARKASEIANNFLAIKRMQNAVMFLQNVGLSTNMSVRVYEEFKDDTIKFVSQNPYKLIEYVDGIGFSTADSIASHLGIDYSSSFRIRAGVVYTLKTVSQNTGSTYLPYTLLKDELERLLNVQIDKDRMDSIIGELIVDMQVRLYEYNGDICVCLQALYFTERKIARKLVQLRDSYVDVKYSVEDDILHYEKLNNITLHEGQKNAIRCAAKNGVSIITGGPGTGKTTIVNCILSIFKARRMSVEMVAPTGRAAKRLSQTTGEDAKTIHRLLDIDFKNGKGFFTFNEQTRLDADVVIVDEVSMVDAFLMANLLSAMKNGSALIIVGDKDQLPSVGAGNVLADMIASGCIPTVCLTEIYRQESDSYIIVNAHRINSGDMPILKNSNSDFFFLEENDSGKTLTNVLDMVVTRIPKFKSVNSTDIQVLCPMKKGILGSININKSLQEILNPPSKDKSEYIMEGNLLRVGDKVMQMSNNYQMKWQRTFDSGTGVYNGDIGYVRSINKSTGEIEIEFEDKKMCVYTQAEAVELSLAYAVSIHKSQGSEFDVVVIPISGGHSMLYTRNLLYTAVTRARQMVVIISSLSNLKRMVDNDYTEKRYSLLCEFIVKESQKDGELQ